MKMFILGMIMMAWFCTGILGTVFDKQFKTFNILMALFIAFVPFIPWIAHWCGLF